MYFFSVYFRLGRGGQQEARAPAYVGVRTACHSVTPDGSPPKHFTAFCPVLSSLEWSHWRLAVWLWAAHFPRLSPLFPSPFYEGRKPRFNKLLDLHSKITAQDKATEWPCHIPCISLPPAPQPRHPHSPSRPRTAPGPPSPSSSSPTHSSSRKSQHPPVAQRPAAPRPPWA